MEEKNKKQKEELQSRRDFFKKTVKGALPILGVLTLGPTFLTSCDPDDEGSTGCGSSCSGGCGDSCVSSCEVNCAFDCNHGEY